MVPTNTISIRFDPGKKDLEKFMGRLEAEIMETIWANGAMTVKRALFFLKKKRAFAYTTVMTVMNRLVEKSVLSREKKGHSYLYAATLEKKKFLTFAAREIVTSLMKDYQPITVNAYYDAKRAFPGKKKPKSAPKIKK